MTHPAPTWQLVLECVRDLDARQGEFTLAEVIRGVQEMDPSRGRSSVQPVVQGMTANAGSGPPSPCGKPLVRVAHGLYQWRDAAPTRPEVPTMMQEARPHEALRARRSPSRRDVDVGARVRGVVAEFADCLQAFDEAVPFQRSGQYEFHRATIERRRAWPTAREALDDGAFLDLLYETLQRWGIGRRASRLVSLDEFRRSLRACGADLDGFGQLQLDDRDADMEGVAARLWDVIEKLHIVENVSLIVPGSKTLHHLLPELVPPMDRAWTGAFFLWSAAAPQSGQRNTFVRTFAGCAEIARDTNCSVYVGDGWRTSISKAVDNAVIGYCKIHQIVLPPST